MSTARAKRVLSIRTTSEGHWVGDGFPVRTLFSYSDGGEELSPFLLLDHAGPMEFSPTEERLGVGPHPHRGFETVTIVHAGEVEHRDSSGAGGRIGPGDVQWMTAAAGVVHEEFHGREFARRGGPFEMVQLWVNLPARHKLAPPRYQAILARDIPDVRLGAESTARVIAGELGGRKGPAETVTPMLVAELRLDGTAELAVPEGWTALLVGLAGELRVNGSAPLGPDAHARLERSGTGLALTAAPGTRALLLAGQPLDEPIAGYGPFVMNTLAEIRQAIADFQAGKMGRL
ncbi:MAG TPA: pirin family protein [Planctomycetota bacterium]